MRVDRVTGQGDTRTLQVETTPRGCYEELRGWFEYPNGPHDYESSRVTCHTTLQTLRLVAIEDGSARVLDSFELERGDAVSAVAQGDDRLFVGLGGYSAYGYPAASVAATIAPGGYWGFAAGSTELLVLGGLGSDDLEVGRLELETGNGYYGGMNQLVASGSRAVVATGWQGRLSVVDGSDPSSPRVVRDVEVPGYVQNLTVVGNTAVASLGYDGVQTIELD